MLRIFFFFLVTQSFVGFRWTELNSITRPGMSEFDARLTTKRYRVHAKRVYIRLESSSHEANELHVIRYTVLNLITFLFFEVVI